MPGNVSSTARVFERVDRSIWRQNGRKRFVGNFTYRPTAKTWQWARRF